MELWREAVSVLVRCAQYLVMALQLSFQAGRRSRARPARKFVFCAGNRSAADGNSRATSVSSVTADVRASTHAILQKIDQLLPLADRFSFPEISDTAEIRRIIVRLNFFKVKIKD